VVGVEDQEAFFVGFAGLAAACWTKIPTNATTMHATARYGCECGLGYGPK
jgi:hypothetical protein